MRAGIITGKAWLGENNNEKIFKHFDDCTGCNCFCANFSSASHEEKHKTTATASTDL